MKHSGCFDATRRRAGTEAPDVLAACSARAVRVSRTGASLFRHALAERRLRTVEQHVDVTTRDAEDSSDVFPRALFQQPEHHDRPLRSAQALYARAKAHVLLRLREQILRGRLAGRRIHVLDRIVRDGEVMTAPAIPRGVLRDRREVGRPCRRLCRRLLALEELQERRQRLLGALDRVLGGQAFPASGMNEHPAMLTDEIGQGFDGIHGAFRG